MATMKINSLLCYVQGIKYGLYVIMVGVSITKSYVVTHWNSGYILNWTSFLCLVDRCFTSLREGAAASIFTLPIYQT